MSDIRLNITRTFDASPEALFDAWTDPAQVAEWYGPEGFGKSNIQAFDAREGGEYSLTMNAPDGGKHKLQGEFKVFDRPQSGRSGKLSFTWQWVEGGMEDTMGALTLVTVEFKPVGDKTEMVFLHEGFASEAIRDSHNKGWSSSFNKLEKVLV